MLETIEAYFDTLIADKTYQSYQDNYNSVNERYIATKKEFEVGLASKTDVAQAESFMNSAKINMLNSKINFNKSINSFSDLIGTKAENMDFSKISVKISQISIFLQPPRKKPWTKFQNLVRLKKFICEIGFRPNRDDLLDLDQIEKVHILVDFSHGSNQCPK